MNKQNRPRSPCQLPHPDSGKLDTEPQNSKPLELFERPVGRGGKQGEEATGGRPQIPGPVPLSRACLEGPIPTDVRGVVFLELGKTTP